MPWHIEQGGGTCESSQWAVIKDDDGSTAGCHDSEQAAKDQMAALYASEGRSMRNRDQLLDAPERRAFAIEDMEFRKDGDTRKFSGYASVVETPYEAFGGPPSGWIETVDCKAFDVTLAAKPDVHLLINHEGMPLARTKSGTLQLSADRKGLKVSADLDRRDPDVQKLEVKMDRRDIDEMSFAWRTKRHKWNEDKTERRILETSLHKGDVSIVNFGMNPAAAGAELRSLLAALDDLDAADALAELRSIDNPVDQLVAARDTIDRLIREATPPERRTLSLAAAKEMLHV